jgi:hypothetical protein
LKRIIDLNEFKRKGILEEIILPHDWMAICDIQQKFESTSILSFLIHNFIDNYYQEYHAITAIKNYLGERWGF